MSPTDVLDFWRAAGRERWFRKDDAFDTEFRSRFLSAHEAPARGELDAWQSSAEGALALLILLDQFPRNCFRATPRMYATDAKAREVARAAVAAGFDKQVEQQLRGFLYLPFMHSESLADHDLSVQLNEAVGGEPLRYAKHHRAIIERFGRFPHRNAILGRANTPEEETFLQEGGFAG
ncbi:DUF924 family protein [Ramlibacter albus]|uniref:DUF924 family protein n=1 Tax=Ramlibacter albus TaxID=2079448 RepID=A0A923M7R4_9BURK|nr:DUF924 family protein [Ramlibacter albus]MBC5764279.1 DUF924 family protein [Ramlibacter albus]